jgi:hypothetical protein
MALDARSGVDMKRLFSPNDTDRVPEFVDMFK